MEEENSKEKLITYRKFRHREDVVKFVEYLEKIGITYRVDNIEPPFDVTFVGGTQLEDRYALSIQEKDFQKLNEFLEGDAQGQVENFQSEHYLYQFTNDELVKVLENYDEWNAADYLLARKILASRGDKYSDEQIQQLKDEKTAELKQTQSGQTIWLIMAVLFGVLGGVLGFFIGHHYYYFKKTLPSGERVYFYDEKTRKLGKAFMFLCVFSFIVWSLIWYFEFY